MLKRYEDAMRSAARLVADVDAEVRRKLVSIKGREERYTEKFVTLLEDRLDGFSDGGIKWNVATHVSDKQSGQETRTGADMFISLTMTFDGVWVQKGVQVQAKINKNKRYGIAFDKPVRLYKQVATMLNNSEESYVFAYGEHGTKVIRARSIQDVAPHLITDLTTEHTADFFFDFFICKVGDHSLHANDLASLQRLVRQLEYRSAVAISARPAAFDR
ncbi:hypothetical protein [Pseudorhizobium banfieldiae]|nr:hypothetical protein [Pseudorhizobium banfieldiae]CAD6603507.1 hypothetical protein RNT25_01390 [arsenite-oxidising bacterium NT-25]